MQMAFKANALINIGKRKSEIIQYEIIYVVNKLKNFNA